MVERKCKGCGAAVKGHKGPVGADRCQNEPVGSEPSDDSTLEQTKTIDAEMKNESLNASAEANDTIDKAVEEKKEPKAGKIARGGKAKKKQATDTTEAETIDQENEDKAATDEKETREGVEKNDDTKKGKAAAKTTRGRGRKKPETEIEESIEDKETENNADNTDQSLEDSKDETIQGDHKKEDESKASKTARGRAKKKPDSEAIESNDKEEDKDTITNNDTEITSEESIEDNKNDTIKEDEKKKSKAKTGGKVARGRAKKKPDSEVVESNDKDEKDTITNNDAEITSEENIEDNKNDTIKEDYKNESKAKTKGKGARGRAKKKLDTEEIIDEEKENTNEGSIDVTDKMDDITDNKEDNANYNEALTDDKENIPSAENKDGDEDEDKNKSDMKNDIEEVANNDTENTLDAVSSMEENEPEENELRGAKGKKKIGKATVKSKKITEKKKALKDITNVSAEADGSNDTEMEGTFVVDKEPNNNDDSIEDSENIKKQTKKQQSRRRTFVIDETPDLAESTSISVIQEGDGTDEENDGIPKNIDMDWTFNLSIDKETNWKRERLYSKSDFSFDVRPYLIGKQFLLCGCNYYDDGDEPFMCDCDAEIHFNKNLTGSVADVFYNPLNDDEDLKPAFKQDLKSWNPDRPNLLKCDFTKVKNKQITSLQGEIHITGERCVEIEKGRKIRCMFFMAEMDLTINGSKTFLTKLNKTRSDSIGNPIKFRKIKFDMISHEEKLPEDSNETGLCSADESIVSKSADMTATISNVADMTATISNVADMTESNGNEEEMEI